jgi:hypothetical protein
MTGVEAIALARRRGVTLEVFLSNLRVYSEGEPDESLVRLLRDNKQAVLDAILAAERESDRWRRTLAEKVETITQLRGLTRPDAERDRDRSPAGSRARSIASQHQELHVWAEAVQKTSTRFHTRCAGRPARSRRCKIPWASG